MNYWPAETCNLSECHEPLFDLISGLARNGAETARTNYGMPGWCSHHNVDIWRHTAPVGEGSGAPTWANWQMTAPGSVSIFGSATSSQETRLFSPASTPSSKARPSFF